MVLRVPGRVWVGERVRSALVAFGLFPFVTACNLRCLYEFRNRKIELTMIDRPALRRKRGVGTTHAMIGISKIAQKANEDTPLLRFLTICVVSLFPLFRSNWLKSGN